MKAKFPKAVNSAAYC